MVGSIFLRLIRQTQITDVAIKTELCCGIEGVIIQINYNFVKSFLEEQMRIDIIGSVASGKTTLAKKISLKYQVPYYEKDNIVWKRTQNGDKKRASEERDELFKQIIAGDNWIVEGSPRKCLKESFECCEYIIVLNERTIIRLARVLRRWILQRLGKENYNSKPTWKFLLYNIKWVFEFNRIKKDLFEELSSYGERCKIFTHANEAMEFIETNYK